MAVMMPCENKDAGCIRRTGAVPYIGIVLFVYFGEGFVWQVFFSTNGKLSVPDTSFSTYHPFSHAENTASVKPLQTYVYFHTPEMFISYYPGQRHGKRQKHRRRRTIHAQARRCGGAEGERAAPRGGLIPRRKLWPPHTRPASGPPPSPPGNPAGLRYSNAAPYTRSGRPAGSAPGPSPPRTAAPGHGRVS